VVQLKLVRPVRYSYIIAAFLLGGCVTPPLSPKPRPEVTKAMGMGSADVQFEGRRYAVEAGMFQFRDGHDDSCVILKPNADHPSASFLVEYGVNSVCLSGHRFRFAGRYVAVTNRSGDRLRLLAKLPKDAFHDFRSLDRALRKLLKQAERKGSNNALELTATRRWLTFSHDPIICR
jgi:hypothetical protein